MVKLLERQTTGRVYLQVHMAVWEGDNPNLSWPRMVSPTNRVSFEIVMQCFDTFTESDRAQPVEEKAILKNETNLYSIFVP